MSFKFAVLDPRPIPAATEANDKVFVGPVFGIEVTVKALAERCIANLDHHGTGSTAETPSACEQAMAAELPPDGATLATVRADGDSVTTMAIFASRLAGRMVDAEFVSAVGHADRLGPKAGARDHRVVATMRKAADFKSPLEARVAWVQSILDGTNDPNEVAGLVRQRDAEFEVAKAASEVRLAADGRIAVVVSTHRFATNLGYEMAAVVVACNPEMAMDFKDPSKGTYKKFTVCRFDDHVSADFDDALRELQAVESGWGGRGDIFGSPQGVSSRFTIDEVVAVVEKYLK